MNKTLKEISDVLAEVRFCERKSDGALSWVELNRDVTIPLPETLTSKVEGRTWPLPDHLYAMQNDHSLWDHILLVIASVNDVLDSATKKTPLLFGRVGNEWDRIASDRCYRALVKSWMGDTERPPLLGGDQGFSGAFLRVAALYHDIGKLIATDHHVPRGVHLMRDVSDRGRREIEALFETLSQRRCFWSLLRHHDVFGVLNTGEASTAAFSSIVGRTAPESAGFDPTDSPSAHISYMLWLNVSDGNASLIRKIGTSLASFEAARYFSDWSQLTESLEHIVKVSGIPVRDAFRTWSVEVSAHPSQAVQRIARLVSSSYRMESHRSPDDNQIRLLVEEALQDQHGFRFDQFCYKFANFCKLDYASGFLRQVMQDCAEESGAAVRKDDRLKYLEATATETETALRTMAYRTCLILGRIVEEYGDLAYGINRAPALLGVDFSKLMSKINNRSETAIAICESLRMTPSRALSWIMDEIGVWLYGG